MLSSDSCSSAAEDRYKSYHRRVNLLFWFASMSATGCFGRCRVKYVRLLFNNYTYHFEFMYFNEAMVSAGITISYSEDKEAHSMIVLLISIESISSLQRLYLRSWPVNDDASERSSKNKRGRWWIRQTRLDGIMSQWLHLTRRGGLQWEHWSLASFTWSSLRVRQIFIVFRIPMYNTEHWANVI